MLAKNSTELVILKLVYVPPNIEIEDPVIVNYHMPDVLSCRTRYLLNWYNNLMAKEYVNIPKGDTVQFCMWRIKTSAAELFTINNIRYDNMLLFVGQENIHWVYFTLVPKFKSAKGITPLTVNYCSCCIDTQYLKFIDSIYENLETTGYILS